MLHFTMIVFFNNDTATKQMLIFLKGNVMFSFKIVINMLKNKAFLLSYCLKDQAYVIRHNISFIKHLKPLI